MANFDAREDALRFVIAHVEARCAALGLAQEVGMRAALILEELFLNAVHHGGAGQCADAQVRVELVLADDELEVRFDDGGIAFDPFSQLADAAHRRPLEEREPGGLGVVLIDGLARRREYQRVGERNCVRIWLPA